MSEKKLDIETFGKIMDQVIYEEDVAILAKFPAGTLEPTIECNLPGSVMQFYLIQYAVKKIFENMKKEMGVDDADWEDFLDKILEILKDTILNEPGDCTPDSIKD